MQAPGTVPQRAGRSQDKQELVDYLKDFGLCPINNEKLLKSVEQGHQQTRNINHIFRKAPGSCGKRSERKENGQEDLRRPRQQAEQRLTEVPEE